MSNPLDDAADAHAQAGLRGCTPLQWYWVGVVHAAMLRDLMPDDYMVDLDPSDPRVEWALQQRLSVEEAAALVFGKVH